MTDIDPARLIIAGFRGSQLPTSYRKSLEEEALGGVILFSRNFAGAAEAQQILSTAQRAQPEMVAAVDQEGGRVQRLKELDLPPASRWRALGDESLAQRAGELVGRFLSGIGFNMDFAPVVDVNTNPHNPVIGDRAFGDEVADVVKYASAFARGLDKAGVASCAKHFPGHGDTDVDSHLALPRLSHAMERLERVELASFAQFVHLPAWMTAHILFTAIDDKHPATLSSRVIAVAREKLGYEGVIVSDDLEMNAIASHHGFADAAVGAVAAGCDALLVCSEESAVQEASEALRSEARTSPAFRERVTQSWGRMAKLIADFPLPRPSVDAWREVAESEETRELLDRVRQDAE